MFRKFQKQTSELCRENNKENSDRIHHIVPFLIMGYLTYLYIFIASEYFQYIQCIVVVIYSCSIQRFIHSNKWHPNIGRFKLKVILYHICIQTTTFCSSASGFVVGCPCGVLGPLISHLPLYISPFCGKSILNKLFCSMEWIIVFSSLCKYISIIPVDIWYFHISNNLYSFGYFVLPFLIDAILPLSN